MFAEGAVERVETFTVLGGKRRPRGEMIPSESLLQAIITWFSENVLRFCSAETAAGRYRREVP